MQIQQDFHRQQHRRRAWQRPLTPDQHVNIHQGKVIEQTLPDVSVAMSSSDGREGYYYTVPIHHRYLLLLV